MDASSAGVTVSNVDPITPSRVALIMVDGGLTPTVVAKPSDPAALLIVAIVGTEEFHVT